MGWPSTDYRDYTPNAATTTATGWKISGWKRLMIYFGVTGVCAAVGLLADVAPLWRASYLVGLGALLVAEGLVRIAPAVAARKSAIE